MHVSQSKGRETAKEPLKTTGFWRLPNVIFGILTGFITGFYMEGLPPIE
jgi:hypothetical protein